jgi:tRNA threonylcarbamoyladenosine biosynthesis protein TsaB
MLVAAVDSATLTLSCALVELSAGASPRLVAERRERAPAAGPGNGHSARLPQALLDLLADHGRTLSDVEGWAAGIGPGSFTGLRIGLATLKGLAYAQRRPLAGASSLAAMALEAASSAPAGALLVPLLDAKKGEVYAGFYRAAGGGVEAVQPEAALAPDALAERCRALLAADGAAPLAFGEGYDAYAERLAGRVARLEADVAVPSAAAVAVLAAPRLLGAAFDPMPLFALEPHYVRASEAEVKFPHGLGPGADRPMPRG